MVNTIFRELSSDQCEINKLEEKEVSFVSRWSTEKFIFYVSEKSPAISGVEVV